MKIPVAIQHAEPADLDRQIGELRKIADVRVPDLENLFAFALIRRDAEQSAAVVHYDVGFGKCAQEVGEIIELRMKEPRFERKMIPLQARKSLAERRIAHQVPRHLVAAEFCRVALVPDGAVADALETAIAGGGQRFEHWRDFVA